MNDKPKHAPCAVQGEPQRKMSGGATLGKKYRASPAYDKDVRLMQHTLQADCDVSLGQICQHYKVCLAEDTQGRGELGPPLLLVANVRAYSVQIILRGGSKNAQSSAAARELFEERYRKSTPR